MSIVLKNIDVSVPEEVNDANLVPVSDEELAEIIEEVGNELVAEMEAAMKDAKLPPEMEEILNAETLEERIELYNKYYHIIFPEDKKN